MAVVLIKKKSGNRASGADIGAAHWITEGRNSNSIYVMDSFWGERIITDPIDKLEYVIAALNVLSQRELGRRRKKKAAKMLTRIENLERRMVNYIPFCTGFYRHKNWRWEDLPANQKVYRPKWRYASIPEEDAEAMLEFLREDRVDAFDFAVDGRYVVVLDDGGMWESMKMAGLVKAKEMELEYLGKANRA